MIQFLKSLFCKHQYIRLRTIHGDEIIGRNYARSEWQCKHCDRLKYSKELYALK